jgi:hypothetical protein
MGIGWLGVREVAATAREHRASAVNEAGALGPSLLRPPSPARRTSHAKPRLKHIAGETWQPPRADSSDVSSYAVDV